MKKISLLIILALCIFILSGCGLAVKTAADTALGGTSYLLVIEPVQDLHPYDSLMLTPFTSSIGGALNEELLAYLNDKVDDYNSQKKLKEQYSRQLHLSGTILHLTDGLYEKQILLQLKFHDTETGKSLGWINVMGEANTIRGLTAVMDSIAESVIDLLVENNFPVRKNSS